MKKKVLFVISTSLQNAGVPHVVMQIVRSLHNQYEFDILVCGEEYGFFDEEFCSFGGQIFRCPLPKNLNSKIVFLKKWKKLYDFTKSVMHVKKYDIIHCNNGFEASSALKIAAKKGVPIRISHSHGYYPIGGKNLLSRWYKKCCRKMIEQYATECLACSKKSGDSLFGAISYINVLNPINLSEYGFSKEKHQGINLLQIGYYNKVKNQKFSIKVLEELLKKDINIKLYFIGYPCGDHYLTTMKQLISELNLTNAVTFLESDYPKEKIMPKIDFLLLPSTSEGLPLVALEGQAARIYCIASDIVCEDVDMGLFHTLPINSPKEWADFILEHFPYVDTLDVEKISKLDTKEYVEQLSNIYDGSGGRRL